MDMDNEDLARKIVSAWEDRNEMMRPLTQEWRENIAFDRGDHWSKWDYDYQRLVAIPNKGGAPRIVINVFGEIVRTVVSQLTRNRPAAAVVPRTSDTKNAQAARCSEVLLSSIFDKVVFEETTEMICKWLLDTGNCIVKTYWDESAGDIEEVESVDPLTGEVSVTSRPKGYPAIDVLGPFSVFVPRECTSPRAINDIIQESLLDVETASSLFGEKLKPDAVSDQDYALAKVRDEQSRYQRNETGKLVRVLEQWIRNEKTEWKWMHHIVANNKVLLSEEWPDTRHPFTFFGMEFQPEAFWRRTWMSDAKSPQRALNEVWSQKIAHMKVAVNPPYMGQRGSFREGRIDKSPGAFNPIETVGSQAPQPMNVGTLAPSVEKMADEAISAMNLVTGVSEVSQGRAPFAQASGRLIAFLSDLDATKLGPVARSLARGVSDIAGRILSLWQDYGPSEETLRYVGSSGLPETMSFYKADLDFVDVKIEESSFLPMNKAVRNDMLERMLQMQVIDVDTFKKHTEFGAVHIDDLDPSARDRSWARENIQRLKLGQAPVEFPFMAEEIHYEELVNFMKEGEFRNETNPMIQQGFMQYEQMLGQRIAQARQAKAAAASQEQMAGQPTAQQAQQPGVMGGSPEVNGATNRGVNTPEESSLGAMMGQ